MPSGWSCSVCLYGVDRNELAAELGKLSLWLATLARDHEFTFLDHCIRYGDSLVGLDRRQIEALSWAQQPAVPVDLMQELLRGRLAAAELERERIRKALDNEPEDQQRLVLRRAEQALADPKLAGDAVIAAFFSADKARAREEARLHIRGVIEQGGSGWQDRLKSNVTALRNGMPPVVPFHWPLQFPEVFDRNNPGFDAIIGNPPFAGKNTTIAVNADHYLDWLQTLHPGAHGNSDIVAHFFRRAYSLLRNGGCFGLLATNTIRQGDTRATGLRPIRQAGGTIYTARRRYKWPGEAAVTISVVHIAKGDLPGAYRLDSREVPLITAFLFHNGNDGDPIRLISNSNTCFEGFKIYGAGFLFEPSPETDDTTSFAEMRDIISRNPNSTRIIKPYLIVDEVNGSANRTPNRFVIDFDDMSEADARKGFPDLMAILEKKVKPYRLKDKRENYRKRWWQFAETRPGLRNALAKLDEVLICPRVQKHWSVVRVDSRICLSDRLDVFCFSSHESFAVLQSRMHELWARFFGSTLEDRLLYTPVDCFETFPLPSIIADPRLQQIGQDYYRFRDGLATEYNEGLTELYNRFHDPDERSNAIGELRRLHDVMDRVILGAYGWTDIRPTCEFELEWEEGEAENGRRRRKPWRYRWPEPVRDEVLARLLALNAQRAEEERLALGDR